MYKSESWKTALLTKDMSGLEPLGRDSSAGWDWPATAWWELENKPRPATAGASLVASWERPQFKLTLAATRAGLGAAWEQLQCEPRLVAAYASSRVLGKDCTVSQGWPPPIWSVRSMLEMNFGQGKQVGQGRISEECHARANGVSQVIGEWQIWTSQVEGEHNNGTMASAKISIPREIYQTSLALQPYPRVS